eukprot:CAMPEP_0180128212 /NCGR_PEP_ID=MMETSP0986-20121125/6635_1 /TAXON_ID=697907 /ORGANISM="non described non described, Strain CCMP2293" /LENGTH=81 /DNA_ID=CAMNT_0022067745 /DNA_START=155 /DNA_END=397 /DNA_ORIENTATION=-
MVHVARLGDDDARPDPPVALVLRGQLVKGGPYHAGDSIAVPELEFHPVEEVRVDLRLSLEAGCARCRLPPAVVALRRALPV